MPFNAAKCKVIAFNHKGNLPPSYKTGDRLLNYVDVIKYLGVIIKLNPVFNSHISSNVDS